MSGLQVIKGKTVGLEALDEAYLRTREHAPECNTVLILMEKKEGGLLWAANENVELRDLLYMVHSFGFRLTSLINAK